MPDQDTHTVAQGETKRMQEQVDILRKQLWAVYEAEERNWYARIIQATIEERTGKLERMLEDLR